MEYELSINPDLDSSIIDYGNYYLELVFPGAVLKDEEDTDSNENSDTFEDMSDVEEVDAEYMELLKDKRNNITKEDSEYRLKKLKYTLGNIVLVKKPFTASERKMPFEEKRKYSFMSRSMLENEREVFSSSSWLPIDILNRGLKLLEFMESRWQFQFKYWNMDKRKILFLDFIDPNQ